MKRSKNGDIGVGCWVEGPKGNWHLLDPRDPWSWFLYPILTLKEWLSEAT